MLSGSLPRQEPNSVSLGNALISIRHPYTGAPSSPCSPMSALNAFKELYLQ